MRSSSAKKTPTARKGIEPVPKARILESFLRDSLRLAGEALGWVEALERDRLHGSVRVVNVRGFYECIHTIKGTALMVAEARSVVEALHALEGVLACRSLVDSAADPSWIPQARQAIERAQAELATVQASIPMEFSAPLALVPPPPESSLGIRVAIERAGGVALVFYPQDWVVEILEPRRWAGRFSWQSAGVAIPIRGGRAGEWPALVLEDPEGFRWVQVFSGTWTLGSREDSGGKELPLGPSWRDLNEETQTPQDQRKVA